jgi:hypothetical protein
MDRLWPTATDRRQAAERMLSLCVRTSGVGGWDGLRPEAGSGRSIVNSSLLAVPGPGRVPSRRGGAIAACRRGRKAAFLTAPSFGRLALPAAQ